MAYRKTGELEKAQEMYAKALPELEYDARADRKNFMSCLNFTINNLGHRRLFLATLPYFEWMLRIYIAIDGREYDTPWNIKKKPDADCNTKRSFPKLKPKRISVERDDRSKIQQVIILIN